MFNLFNLFNRKASFKIYRKTFGQWKLYEVVQATSKIAVYKVYPRYEDSVMYFVESLEG